MSKAPVSAFAEMLERLVREAIREELKPLIHGLTKMQGVAPKQRAAKAPAVRRSMVVP
jgi:hypothetical protein